MYGDFLNSAKGRLLTYRTRKKRVFQFLWEGKLQSKKSASAKINLQFQKELLKQMQLFGFKGPFTGALMVEILFWAASRNSPEVHTLAKHYLDLLQWPAPGLQHNRSKVLVRNDSQIEFLTCLYSTRTDGDGLRLRVRRLTDFFADLELYNDVSDEFDDDYEEAEQLDSAIRDYKWFVQQKQAFIARYDSKTYKKMELIWKRDAQAAVLAKRQPDFKILASLLRPRYDRLRKHHEFAAILTTTSKMTRSAFEHPFMSVNFGARAVKAGESKEFKHRVRQGLLDAKAREPLLYPLLAPCGVTVLYLPPKNASKIDLDNLVRESIIPSVHEILQPPGTPRDFLISINEDKIDLELTTMLERYKQAPRFHITGYQVLCLPRTSEDPENGNVRLILHGGDVWQTPWEMLDSALTKWEDSDSAI